MNNNKKIKILKKYLKEMIKIYDKDLEIAIEYGTLSSQRYIEGIFTTYQDIYKFLERLESEEK